MRTRAVNTTATNDVAYKMNSMNKGFEKVNTASPSDFTYNMAGETPLGSNGATVVDNDVDWNEAIDDDSSIEGTDVNLDLEDEDMSFSEGEEEIGIKSGFAILRRKNEKSRVTVVYAAPRCTWRIHASPADGEITYMIKSMCKEHRCSRAKENKDIISIWIASHLATQLKADPDMKTSAMAAYFMENFQVKIPYITLYRAKKIVIGVNEESNANSFAKLPSYGEILRERNQGSLFKLQFHERKVMSDPPIFERVFVYFKACINGFLKGCRPFIGVDGCQLKGMFGGVLLSAIAIDGNRGLFPIAYAIVEYEYKDNWLFFLTNLYATLYTVIDDIPITFMSDREKAIQSTFSQCQHRWCCRHLYQNFQGTYHGVLLRRLFWSTTKASTPFMFEKEMNETKAINKDVHDWLLKNPPKMWFRHAFDFRCKSDHITNNMTESFNQWISSVKSKHILILINEIRKQLLEVVEPRYRMCCIYTGNITPRIQKMLTVIRTESRWCIVLASGLDEFEVTYCNYRSVVDLKKRSCGCKIQDATGLPCKHAAACIENKRKDLKTYCDE
ncbi:uncharacterized protein LOC122067749 [Macadamia integrifolia]|uniref:uncharacterized protein LOC122067749 n=1 Tax=Macadamia integrifolia TaxID=60698 RepID=UPI001C4EA661|nr:uncharacterized protein LOC122067749 [Macadamia integrifolia]